MKCFSKNFHCPRQALQLSHHGSKSKLGFSYFTDVMRKSFMLGADDVNSQPKTSVSSSRASKSDECSVAASLSDITDQNEWVLLQVSEPRPSPRAKHAAVGVGSNVFVVGGTSVNGVLGDVHAFDIDSFLWAQIWPPESNSSTPSETALDGMANAHAPHRLSEIFAGVWKEKLVVVGCRADRKDSVVSAHSYDFSLGMWSTLRPKGDCPDTCQGFTIIQVGSSLVMFGGEDSTGRIVDDLFILDLENNAWVSVPTTGVKPAPRKYHTMACHSGRYVWIYGGRSYATYYNDVYCLDLKLLEWNRVKTKGEVPPTGRSGHVGIMEGNKFYIVGGENRGDEMVDTLVLDIQTSEWSIVTTVHPMSPLAHDGVSVIKVRHEDESYLLAFGGHGTFMSCQMYAMLLTAGNTSSRDSTSSTNTFDANFIESGRRERASPVNHFDFRDNSSLSSSSENLDNSSFSDYFRALERPKSGLRVRSPTVPMVSNEPPVDAFMKSVIIIREVEPTKEEDISKPTTRVENKSWEKAPRRRSHHAETRESRVPIPLDTMKSRVGTRGQRNDPDILKETSTAEKFTLPQPNRQVQASLKVVKELQQALDLSPSTCTSKEDEELADELLTVKELQQDVFILKRNKEVQQRTVEEKSKRTEVMTSKLELKMQQHMRKGIKSPETLQAQVDRENVATGC